MQLSPRLVDKKRLIRPKGVFKILVILGVLLALSFLGVYFHKPILFFVGERLSTIEVRTVQKVVTQEEAVISVVEKASPAVVSIVESRVVLNPFSGLSAQEQGIGTGFIVEGGGVILTNRHVVSDKTAEYTVVTSDGNEYEVEEIHRDFAYDLAILKISASGLPAVTLGDSEGIQVGQTVVAIGNALGRFSNTVTAGVVSGIGRGIEASAGFGSQAEYLEDVIQTDAALNPGNSGGPLFNLSAEVVGINVAIASAGENIGFSIPINIAKPVLEDFLKHGRIIRPFLGVSYYVITEDLARLHDLPQGAFVQTVFGESGAARAGVKVGDIITAIDGKAISEQTTLSKIIVSHKVGDKVTLSINRRGKEITLKATLGEAPTD